MLSPIANSKNAWFMRLRTSNEKCARSHSADVAVHTCVGQRYRHVHWTERTYGSLSGPVTVERTPPI
jgi:hypothetical protein